MRHAHFLVLTGRLNEFPLHELIETLRGQQKTGRLQVEFKAGPCALYFREGALVEATLGTLRGLEALSLALSLQQEDAAPFNFNPLVAPPDAPGKQGQANGTIAFANESAAHARARVIEVEPEPEAAPTQARRDDSNGPRPAAQATPQRLEAPNAPPLRLDAHLDGHAAPRLDARADAPQLEASAGAARPRALLPAAEEGALVERLARIETVVATQARRANIERAVYAALIFALIIAALLWRGRDASGTDAATNGASPVSSVVGADKTIAPEAPASASGSAVDSSSAAAKSSDASASSVTTAAKPEILAAKPTTRSNDPRARQSSAIETDAPVGKRQMTVAADKPAEMSAAKRADKTGRHIVQVRMTVVRGRVLRAEVSNPRAGMAAYEALALRMARQRRYPEEFSGQETLRLPIGQ